ncbi:hypothetical protein [Deinococcus peraridilitoris]|uniref:hypothetical protein n=1 Tax=Deinococcus peraridilitoris TaxID=432329 RepID=UPI000313DBCA|nr:hypothetical protein [Deinococcus peraridilitoris]
MLAATFHVHSDGVNDVLQGHFLSVRSLGWGAALVATVVLIAGIWAVTINERAALMAAREAHTKRRNEELEDRVAARTRELHYQTQLLQRRNEELQAETDALKASVPHNLD